MAKISSKLLSMIKENGKAYRVVDLMDDYGTVGYAKTTQEANVIANWWIGETDGECDLVYYSYFLQTTTIACYSSISGGWEFYDLDGNA